MEFSLLGLFGRWEGSKQRVVLDAPVTNLKPLGGFDIRWLEIHNDPKFSDLSQLSYTPALEVLHITRCQHVKDLSPLVNLPNLKVLNIDGCLGVEDLEPLVGCLSLRSLNLGKSHCTKLEPILRIATLEELFLPESLYIPAREGSPTSVYPCEISESISYLRRYLQGNPLPGNPHEGKLAALQAYVGIFRALLDYRKSVAKFFLDPLEVKESGGTISVSFCSRDLCFKVQDYGVLVCSGGKVRLLPATGWDPVVDAEIRNLLRVATDARFSSPSRGEP